MQKKLADFVHLYIGITNVMTCRKISEKNGKKYFGKNSFAVFLIIFLLNQVGYAQVFDLNNVVLFKTGTSSKGLIWGQSTSIECEELFGKPTSKESFYSEMDEDTLQLYKYGKNELYFDKGVLRIFDLVDALMSIGDSKGNTFKIGDMLKIKNGVKTFAGFRINDKHGNSRNLNYQGSIFLNLKRKNIVMDSGIEFLFDTKNTLFSIALLD